MVSALDVFKQNISTTTRDYEGYQTVWRTNAKLQNFRIALTYNLGNTEVQAKDRDLKNNEKQRAQ